VKYILNAAKMKAVDQYTIEVVGIPAMVLMEQAALSVAAVMRNAVKRTDRILAVCGMGNNGGDGVAIARILKEYGYHVSIMMIGDESKMTKETKQQLEIAKKLGADIINNGRMIEYNVIIDAIFGIGLSKPITGEIERVIKEINHAQNRVFSVDIPSGIHADNGHVINVAVIADTTVTFGLNKQGLVLYPGCMYAGEIIVADIGFPGKAVESAKPDTFIYEEMDLQRLPIRKSYSNKGTYGKVLVIAGSKNMSGACYLSAKAAYRTGAGLVKVLTTEENRTIIQTILPEAILSTYDSDAVEQSGDEILQAIQWASVVVIGPGIGVSPSSSYLLHMVLQHANVPVIIDADAITLLSQDERYSATEGKCMVPANSILTPHVKEMASFLHQSVQQVVENLTKTAMESLELDDSILVLKDARTMVTNGLQLYVNLSGNNGLATGGSGDVLTGIIAALIAQGLDKFQAASLGVYIHGLAGDFAVSKGNSYSLIASDIIEALPMVLDTKEI
jgi:NAD(P)H-hydrate epimerase